MSTFAVLIHKFTHTITTTTKNNIYIHINYCLFTTKGVIHNEISF